MKFICISEKNTNMDFSALKAAGIEGVYIRASHGQTKDNLFEQHYANAKEADLKVSAYHLYEAPKKKPYTITSCKEGRAFGAVIKGKKFDMPIAIHMGNYRGLELPAIYNGINALAQNIDKKSRMLPVWKTDKLIVGGNYLQLDIIAEDHDLDVYPKWCLGDQLYTKAKILPVEDFNEFVVYEG